MLLIRRRARAALLRLPSGQLHRLPARFIEYQPMTIADRRMADAVQSGALSGLSGEGKPLAEQTTTQVLTASLSKNMEARAEAEMRRYSASGFLKDLGGLTENEAAERALHGVATRANSQEIIQHVVKEGVRGH